MGACRAALAPHDKLKGLTAHHARLIGLLGQDKQKQSIPCPCHQEYWTNVANHKLLDPSALDGWCGYHHTSPPAGSLYNVVQLSSMDIQPPGSQASVLATMLQQLPRTHCSSLGAYFINQIILNRWCDQYYTCHLHFPITFLYWAKLGAQVKQTFFFSILP